MSKADERPSTRSNHSWMITIPLLGLAAAYFFLWHTPCQREIQRIEKELALDELSMAAARMLPVRLEQTRRELRQTREYLDNWRRRSPGDRVSALYGQIAAIMNEAGTKTTRFNPEPAVAHGVVRAIPLNFACQGTFHQTLAMLHALEELPATIWIEELRMERWREDGAQITCEVKLEIFADKLDISN